VSPRVYRPAWSHSDALSLLRQESGTAFDERCVSALARVLERERMGDALRRRVTSDRPARTRPAIRAS
jgi:HD-GYP domain-containing protein (c-di-GMP phosphodiesterase class II)